MDDPNYPFLEEIMPWEFRHARHEQDLPMLDDRALWDESYIGGWRDRMWYFYPPFPF